MYRIVRKEALKPTVILYEIEAPMVAKKAEPGQFIILRVDENGERIPITIHDYHRENDRNNKYQAEDHLPSGIGGSAVIGSGSLNCAGGCAGRTRALADPAGSAVGAAAAQ